MSALKILIIEDDIVLATELEEQLLEFGYSITDTTNNSDEALLAFRRRIPDLVLCDINLEGSKLDGIELVKKFNSIERVPVIFLTAFGDAETTSRARVTRPSAYLIKPCNELQLESAIELAVSNFASDTLAQISQSLKTSNIPSCLMYSSKDFVFVRVDTKFVRLEIANIVWVEALGANVKIITDEFTAVLAANLSSFTRQISNPGLQRVHRSYIVNINKIVAFDGGRAFVVYKNGQKEIPIGKTYRSDFQSGFPKLQAD